MQYIFPYRKQDLSRIRTPIDHQFKIEAYGANNLYPQEQEYLRLGSPLVKTATNVLADFINGEGWEENGDEVLNEDGELANDLLDQTARDFSKYNGFALWLGFDGTGQITEIKNIPFDFVRFGEPDKFGKHSDVKVSNDWVQDPDVNGAKTIEPVTYPLYNPLTAQEETIKGGNGQVLYYTGTKDLYPLSTFDSINNTALTDAEIQAFEKNTSTKGFLGTTLFKYPGKFESKEEQAIIERKIQALQGSDSPGILLAQIDEEFTGALIETIAPNNNDQLFSLTRQAIIDRVLQVYSIPPALMGINPAGGVFSQTSYKESFVTYGVITRNRRKIVARTFNTLGALMDTPLTFGEIAESRFEVQGQDTDDAPNQFQPAEEINPAPPEEVPQENNLKVIYK